MDMFCYQCEQTAQGSGCTKVGVCGKDPETAALQDLLVYATRGIATLAHRARQLGKTDAEIDRYIPAALFVTVTNVEFDPGRMERELKQADAMLQRAHELYQRACADAGKEPEQLPRSTTWRAGADRTELIGQAVDVGVRQNMNENGPTVAGLLETLTYGLKGASAYIHHAAELGKEDPDLYAEVERLLDVLNQTQPDVNDLLGECLKAGAVNLRAMELLDAGHTEAYGHPEPTQVRITPVKGKAILVSGHDLPDLEALLEQTRDTGINVYTHGEMLPAHGYPRLKAYPHLVGNYGGAWQDQRKEFDEFPGAIVMTTNCIQRPADTYKARIFTRDLVGWPGVTHLPDRDFGPAIAAAQAAPGFAEDAPEKTITVGFARNAVLGVADKVVEAVKGGDLRHFFLIGGCDGARTGRNYFTEMAEAVPEDCVILTLACGKYRFNKLEFGDIGGIPRLLDVGQCNDAYSAVQIAVALAKAFDCDVNDLPLSLVLSWYEQKAVAILLTLLYLGIKNIRLGPTLPAFLTPEALQVLIDKFEIKPTTTAEDDLEAILGTAPADKA